MLVESNTLDLFVKISAHAAPSTALEDLSACPGIWTCRVNKQHKNATLTEMQPNEFAIVYDRSAIKRTIQYFMFLKQQQKTWALFLQFHQNFCFTCTKT